MSENKEENAKVLLLAGGVIIDGVHQRGEIINIEELKLKAKRFDFCLKWGWPTKAAAWSIREGNPPYEFWLPGEEMSVHICRGNSMVEVIDAAILAVEEAMKSKNN